MPRRAQHRKGCHRKQHGVQAGHHWHAGNGRIAENRRDPERSKGKTGQYVGGTRGAIHWTEPGEDRQLAASGTCGPSAAGQPRTHSHTIRWEVTTLHHDSRSGTCVILARVSGRRADSSPGGDTRVALLQLLIEQSSHTEAIRGAPTRESLDVAAT